MKRHRLRLLTLLLGCGIWTAYMSLSHLHPPPAASPMEDVPLVRKDSLHPTAPILQNETSRGSGLDPRLLLSVPFYVYEDLAWVNATLGGVSIATLLTESSTANGSPVQFLKHSNDYWFLLAALRHPLRTQDPSQAKLFVIPTLLNLYSLRVFQTAIDNPDRYEPQDSLYANVSLCWNGLCDRDLLVQAGRKLNASHYIHTRPHHHLVTTSHYGYHLKGKLKMPALLRQQLYRCHAISYERKIYNDHQRLRFPSYLVGHACPATNSKPYDVALIASFKDDDERFQDRRQICNWLQTLQEQPVRWNSTSLQVPICGTGAQCPALGQAKLGLHVRGDTYGSQRLMDTLLSGTVPIFTHVEQYQVQPSWIDWNQLSYFIDMKTTTTLESFARQLRRILDNHTDYQLKQEQVLQHIPLFNWTTLYPFDTYMYMLQAAMYPATTRTIDSDWPALILPPTKNTR